MPDRQGNASAVTRQSLRARSAHQPGTATARGGGNPLIIKRSTCDHRRRRATSAHQPKGREPQPEPHATPKPTALPSHPEGLPQKYPRHAIPRDATRRHSSETDDIDMRTPPAAALQHQCMQCRHTPPRRGTLSNLLALPSPSSRTMIMNGPPLRPSSRARQILSMVLHTRVDTLHDKPLPLPSVSRPRYSRVSVSILIRSPSLINCGTEIWKPVSTSTVFDTLSACGESGGGDGSGDEIETRVLRQCAQAMRSGSRSSSLVKQAQARQASKPAALTLAGRRVHRARLGHTERHRVWHLHVNRPALVVENSQLHVVFDEHRLVEAAGGDPVLLD